MADKIDIKRLIPGKIYGNCIKDRQQRKPFYEPISQPKKFLKYLYRNFGGPYPATQKNNQFYLGIQDDVTGACYAKFIRTKDQIFGIFQNFICQAERQLGKKLKHLQTNFREKFANKAFEKYIGKDNVKWEPSALYTPEQNGKVKCFNDTLMSLVHLILSAIYLPKML